MFLYLDKIIMIKYFVFRFRLFFCIGVWFGVGIDIDWVNIVVVYYEVILKFLRL